jgi:hypothetical protein
LHSIAGDEDPTVLRGGAADEVVARAAQAGGTHINGVVTRLNENVSDLAG